MYVWLGFWKLFRVFKNFNEFVCLINPFNCFKYFLINNLNKKSHPKIIYLFKYKHRGSTVWIVNSHNKSRCQGSNLHPIISAFLSIELRPQQNVKIIQQNVVTKIWILTILFMCVCLWWLLSFYPNIKKYSLHIFFKEWFLLSNPLLDKQIFRLNPKLIFLMHRITSFNFIFFIIRHGYVNLCSKDIR